MDATELQEVLRNGGHARGASLPGADLRKARIPGADLAGADLRGGRLGRVDAAGADLSGADLSGADLKGARLQGARLQGAVLRDALLDRADLTGADLSGADLSGCALGTAVLDGACLDGADLTRAGLERVRARDLRLAGAVLREARLVEAQLESVDLSGADLTGADLEMVRIEGFQAVGLVAPGASMRSALWRRGSLAASDLSGVDLSHGNLESVSLLDADLTGVRAHGAEVHDVDWDGARVDGAALTAVHGLRPDVRADLASRGARVTVPLHARVTEVLWRSAAGKALALAALVAGIGALAWLLLAPQNRPVEELADQARDLVDRGRGAEAMALYDVALAKTAAEAPERVYLLLERASALERLGRLDEALSGYREAAGLARLRPESDAPTAYSNFLSRMGKHDARLEYAAELMGKGDDPWLRLVGLVIAADAEVALGRTEEGRLHATQALALLRSLPEREPELAVRVSDALASTGETEQAMALLAEYGSADAASQPHLAYEAARLLWEAGRGEEALAAWARLADAAVATDPSTALEARLAWIDGLVDLGRAEEALRLAGALAKSTSEDGAVGGATRVAAILERRGDLEGADAAWADLARRFPRQAVSAELGRAGLKLGAGDPAGALAAADALLAGSLDGDARFQVAQFAVSCLQAAGRDAEAAARLEEMVRLWPDRSDLQGPLALARAQALQREGRVEEALSAFREAARTAADPESRRAAAFAEIGILRAAGRNSDAAAAADALARGLAPGDGDYSRAALAAIEARAVGGDWEAALAGADALLAAVSGEGERGMVLRTLVETAIGAAKGADARRWLERAETEGLSGTADVRAARLAWAMSLDAAGDPAGALRIYDSLAQEGIQPDLAGDLWSRRIAALVAAGRQAEAEALLASPPAGVPSTEARCRGPFERARRLAGAGDAAAAESAFRGFLAGCADAAFLADNVGSIADDLVDAGGADRADALLKSALPKLPAPAAGPARLALGDLAAARGEADVALGLYAAARTSLDPASEHGIRARLREADVLSGRGSSEPALAAYRAVLALPGLDPGTRSGTWMNVSRILRGRKDFAGAKEALARAREGQVDRQQLAWLAAEEADTDREAGRADVAAKAYAALARGHAEAPEAAVHAAIQLSQIHAERGEGKERVAALVALAGARLPPESAVQVLDALAGARWEEGDRAGAEAAWKEIASRYGALPGARCGVALSRGGHLRGAGRHAEAVAEYRRALDVEGDRERRSQLLQSIADSWRESGDARRAVEAYRRVIAETPDTEAASSAAAALAELAGDG